MCLEKYLSRNFRDPKKDELFSLEQGGMFLAAYEPKFDVVCLSLLMSPSLMCCLDMLCSL